MNLEEKLRELLAEIEILAEPLGGLCFRDEMWGRYFRIDGGNWFQYNWLEKNIKREVPPGDAWIDGDIHDLAEKMIDHMIDFEYRMFSKKEFTIECFLEDYLYTGSIVKPIFGGKFFIGYGVRGRLGNEASVTKRFLKYIGMTEDQFLLKYKDCKFREKEMTIKSIYSDLVGIKTVDEGRVSPYILSPKLIKRIDKKFQSPFILARKDYYEAVAVKVNSIWRWAKEHEVETLGGSKN